jgi:tRNA A37 threonylcarbamoyladenosine modification protein TsaB
MSVLLAIDTSAGTSVALFRDRKLAAEVNVVDNMKHAETIGTAIAQVLRPSDVSVSMSTVTTQIVLPT